jgi:hypothetical protein
MKTPHKDESVKEGLKRTYWTRDMAVQGRRVARLAVETTLAKKGKKWSKADRQKAVDERWGQFCESQHSIADGQAMLREHPGIDRQEHNFARRKG